MRVRRVLTIPLLVIAICLAAASTAAAGGGGGGVQSFTVPLTGPNGATGSAQLDFYVRPGAVCYYITTTNVPQPLTAVHIHEGATGTTGPIALTVFSGSIFASTIGLPDGTICAENLDNGTVRSVARKPQNFYVDVHSQGSATPALRGQLG